MPNWFSFFGICMCLLFFNGRCVCVYLWYSYSMEEGQILMINMCPSMPPKIIWLQMERAIIIRRSCHSLPSIKRIFSQAHTQKTHSIRKSSHYTKTNIMEIVCKQSLQGRQTQTSNMRILSMLPHSFSSPRKCQYCIFHMGQFSQSRDWSVVPLKELLPWTYCGKREGLSHWKFHEILQTHNTESIS